VARWACGAKWAEGPALQAQCATPLGLTLSEGLGRMLREPCLKAEPRLLQDRHNVEEQRSFAVCSCAQPQRRHCF
jgi:hypothetical protein